MKKRKPDILYDGFRNKFFDHESKPLPDSKEKIFTDFYSEELKNKSNEPIYINRPIKKFPIYKYAAAASIIGLLMIVGIIYLTNRSIEKDQLVINSQKITVNPEKEISNNNLKKEDTNLQPPLKANTQTNKNTELKTYRSAEEKLVVFLPDSSKVYLNKHSELSYSDNFSKGERIVYMTGEVYFDVKKLNKKPFIVFSNISRVEVLGTSFSIKSLPDEREEIIVESGKVLFAEKANKESNKLLMTPGMKAYLDSGKPIVNVVTDHTNDLSWKNNKLVFNKSPIKDVIEKIESYFEVKIILVDPNVLNCHFTGTFEKPRSLKEVLEIISLSINGSFEIKNKEYILSSKGCN